MSVFWRAPNSALLEQIYKRAIDAAPTYGDIGATAGRMPNGFRHDSFSFSLGKGQALFEGCCAYLDNWDLQRAIDFVVYPELLARVARPVARRLQLAATHRYGEKMQEFAHRFTNG